MTPPNKLTIDYIREQSFSRWGFILLEEEYKNNLTPMKFKDSKTGKVFKRSWASLISGKIGTTNVNDYQSDKNFFESYHNLGYILDMTEDEYLHAETQSGNKIFKLIHKDLKEPWFVKKGHFKTLAESHLNNTGRSMGETIIEQVLRFNNINFEAQKKVYIESTLNLFDFYLPEYHLYIEYDGKQHFIPIKRWGGEPGLKRRMIKDELKNRYVDECGEKILRIPYTASTTESIIEYLINTLKLSLKSPNISVVGIKKEVAEYYDTHTAFETENKFKLNRHTITRYYKQAYGSTKIRRHK